MKNAAKTIQAITPLTPNFLNNVSPPRPIRLAKYTLLIVGFVDRKNVLAVYTGMAMSLTSCIDYSMAHIVSQSIL